LPLVAQNFIRKGKTFSFTIWLVNLFVISANVSDFLRNRSTDSISTLAVIALVSLVICIVNFGVGALLGDAVIGRKPVNRLDKRIFRSLSGSR